MNHLNKENQIKKRNIWILILLINLNNSIKNAIKSYLNLQKETFNKDISQNNKGFNQSIKLIKKYKKL